MPGENNDVEVEDGEFIKDAAGEDDQMPIDPTPGVPEKEHESSFDPQGIPPMPVLDDPPSSRALQNQHEFDQPNMDSTSIDLNRSRNGPESHQKEAEPGDCISSSN
ncbi:hypothetical protein L2E82_51721 [Cichorium intybus]|nr:hypothetical protein L2E82_51721 [Cichorium intybus]